MNLLTKLIELLFTRHWVALLLSLVLGVKLYTVLPSVLLINISILSVNTNMIIGCVECIIITYLVIYFIDHIIKKEKCGLDNYRKKKEHRKSIEVENRKLIERWKSDIDGWSDDDYSFVMWILRRKNKVPLVQPREKHFNSYMFEDNILNKSEYHGEGKKVLYYFGTEKEFMLVENGFQYLLKPDVYE